MKSGTLGLGGACNSDRLATPIVLPNIEGIICSVGRRVEKLKKKKERPDSANPHSRGPCPTPFLQRVSGNAPPPFYRGFSRFRSVVKQISHPHPEGEWGGRRGKGSDVMSLPRSQHWLQVGTDCTRHFSPGAIGER